MKKYIKLILIAILYLSVTSCLEHGLEDLPEFELNDITGVQRVEYRFVSDEVSPVDGEKVVKFVALSYTADVDETQNKVILQVSTPAPSSVFPIEEKRKVNNANIAVMVSISTAARIAPVGDAPLLGVPGDWSKPNKYKVTAGDGSVKEWTIEVEPLPEINAYEGFYSESGTLVRAGNAPDELSGDIYLETVNENTCRAQAGKAVFNNPGILYQIQINADNTVTIKSDPNSVVEMFPQEGKVSTYDPANKTFDLHYHYRNGDRLFDTKLVMK